MNLEKENVTRKIDSSGRVVIPKSMQERFKLKPGDEVEFFNFIQDGIRYICFAKCEDLENSVDEVDRAIKVLEKYGLEVPEKLTCLSGGKTEGF